MSQPLVSVIIPAWNGSEHLEACLTALQTQTYSPLEVIVVDNASSDESADLVERLFPNVKLIINSQNLGFSGGCNTGLRVAQGDILILLNQDTIVEPEWAGALVEVFEADLTIGIAGGKAFYPDDTIQHAGGYVDKQGSGHHYGHGEPDNGQFDQIRDVDFVTGATLAISRQAFNKIGPLDERFTPAYFEDVDWCYRAKLAGFRTVYVPNARLMHKEESRSTDATHEGMYLFHRHRIRFVFKQWPLERLTEEFLPTEQSWLEELGEGGERLIAAMHHAYLFHLLHLADIMSWRQKWLNTPLSEADQVAHVLTKLRCVVPLPPARLHPSTGSGQRLEIESKEQDLLEKATQGPDTNHLIPEERKVHTQKSDDVLDMAEGSDLGKDSSPFTNLLAQLHQRWALREHKFDSHIPIVGRLIATCRRQWYRIAAKWSIREVIHQQNQVNLMVLQLLTLLQQEQQEQERFRTEQERLHAEQERLYAEQSNRIGQLHGALSVRVDQVSNQLLQEGNERQRLGEVLAEYLAENGRELAEIAHLLRSVHASSNQPE